MKDEDFFDDSAQKPDSNNPKTNNELLPSKSSPRNNEQKDESSLRPDARYGSECDTINRGFQERTASTKNSNSSSASPPSFDLSSSVSFVSGTTDELLAPEFKEEELRSCSVSNSKSKSSQYVSGSPQLFTVSGGSSLSGYSAAGN